MQDVFEKALNFTFDNEGGFTNLENDSGGATNFGITQDELSQYRKHPVSLDDVKNMTSNEAKQIYFAHYWTPLNCSKMSSEAIAIALFDVGVLYGIGTSAKMAQSILGGLKIDGLLGDISIGKLNEIDPKAFLEALKDKVYARIEDVINENSKNEDFRKGWQNRADKLLTLA